MSKIYFTTKQLLSQAKFEIFNLNRKCCITETIKRDNIKPNGNSSLETISFLFDFIFDFAVNKFVTILSFFDGRT